MKQIYDTLQTNIGREKIDTPDGPQVTRSLRMWRDQDGALKFGFAVPTVAETRARDTSVSHFQHPRGKDRRARWDNGITIGKPFRKKTIERGQEAFDAFVGFLGSVGVVAERGDPTEKPDPTAPIVVRPQVAEVVFGSDSRGSWITNAKDQDTLVSVPGNAEMVPLSLVLSAGKALIEQAKVSELRPQLPVATPTAAR